MADSTQIWRSFPVSGHWLEAPRANERFKMVWMLQAAHTLLQLRPIVDAELPHCPVFVFPSWEKSLEEHDLVTMAGIGQLVTDVLAAHVDSGITSLDEAMEFVKRNPGKLVDRAGTNTLLVVPGGPIGGPSERVLTDYEAEIGKWRSVEAMARFRALSPDEKALNILFERLGPQYHLLENSDELSAHPLVSVPQQAHYFRVVAGTNNCRLERLGLLEKKTAAVVSAFGTARLAWISKVSPEALIEIRGNNENEAFRKTLRAALTDLQDSALEDTDRVAAEVCREIDSAIADHQRQVRDSERINRRSKVTWAAGLLAAGASSMVPQLAPFLGKILPFGVAAKAAWDLYCVNSDRRRRARSLMGILAVLRDQDE
ncbi:MAG: hypothetical protein BGO92_09690 [Magnetospirillum sp. 64-120]|nr:MAG: hypothetical protein BGO92_09690 [Magnetospirillum sp. 64-120]